MTDRPLVLDGGDPAHEGRREALCTLGNGRLATRGAAPESAADGVHYPGTYTAGCYDRVRDEVAGRPVDDESLVNLPNWLDLRFAVDDGDWVDLAETRVLEPPPPPRGEGRGEGVSARGRRSRARSRARARRGR